MKKALKISAVILVAVTAIVCILFYVQFSSYQSYISRTAAGPFKIPVNTSAPVLSEAQLTINAPAEKVFAVLNDINNWPAWQKDVTETQLQSAPAEGTVFLWKAGGLSFESKIHTNTPSLFFGWTGTTFGAYAVHNWQFVQNDSSTTVTVHESLQGFIPWLMSSFFQSNLDKGVIKNLNELKAAVEKK